MIDFKTSLKWNGPTCIEQIKEKIRNNLKAALDLYYNRLREKISKWGSFGGKRVVHSRPGEPPRRQTGNLYNSIQVVISEGPTGIEGTVFTDVAYAPTLEHGGELQVEQSEKIHADFQLINPFQNAITISPRPAWVPTLQETADEMNDILAR